MARAEVLGLTRRGEPARPRLQVADTPAPRQPWLVIGLLALAGGVMLYQDIPLVVEVAAHTFSPFEALGLFYLGYLVELSVLGVVLLALSYRVFCGEASARLTAALLCGALGVGYLLQEHRADTENWVMLCSLVVAALVAVAPTTRWWLASGGGRFEPPPVALARTIAGAMGMGLGLLGLSALPMTSSAGVFALVGAGLGVGGILIFRSLRGVRTGDAGARASLSGAMIGDLLLLAIARSQAPAAEALTVPMALAGAVVALLWLPALSRTHFTRAPADASLLLPRSSAQNLQGGQPAAPTPAPPMAVPPAPVRVSEPVPPAPPPAPSIAVPRPVAVPVPAPPPPAPALAPAPAPAVVHVEVGVVEGSRRAKTSALHMIYDQESWFPEPDSDEQVIGAYLVLALLHGDGGSRHRIFEGTSTLLITHRRLAGVCPRGAGRQAALNSTHGPVIPWSVPLDQLSEATTAASTSGAYVSMSLIAHPRTRILLARPRIARQGGFAPVDVAQLARDLRRARRAAAPASSLEGSRNSNRTLLR